MVNRLVAVDDEDYRLPAPVRLALVGDFTQADELVINVARFPSVQAAIDAAPTGATLYFPPTMSPVAVPAGGFALKANNLTIDAMGIEFQVSNWGTPAFLALRSNGGADGHRYRIGMVKYVGVRGNHTGTTMRGSAPYCSGCGVWSNGDRNYVEYLRTDGMPTPIFFSSWDGSGATDRTGVGNRIGYVEFTRYNFGLLYVKQTGFDWGDAYVHDDLDDSGGVNPTHAIYCSAASGHRAGQGTIGRWQTVRNVSGHAYIFKFQDSLTFDSLTAVDSAGLVSFLSTKGIAGNQLIGTDLRSSGSDRAVSFSGVERCEDVSIGRIEARLKTGVQSWTLGLWVDGLCEIGSVNIETNHAAGLSTAVPEVTIRGVGSGRVGSLMINAKGVHSRPVELGDGTLAGQAAGWTLPIVRAPGSDNSMTAVPVAEYALSHSNAWGDGNTYLVAASPAKGVFRRGMRWGNSAPSVGVARGWVQIANGALSAATWAASTAVTAGAWWKLADGRVIRYLTAGTTGSTEPNPSTVGQTGGDGTTTWELMSAASASVVSEGNL
ncbi:hypothetical protein JQN58_34940 [Aneurinibacillus sp. BA2021]|nr:hypothetical protein [Aneurinibacillus sp. BA2021]